MFQCTIVVVNNYIIITKMYLYYFATTYLYYFATNKIINLIKLLFSIEYFIIWINYEDKCIRYFCAKKILSDLIKA